MAVPAETKVLIIGGGPGGSYTASVLAREGVDCVMLEAVKFPRYHIGESMLSSMRHFLEFIDLDEKFDEYGFQVKRGAAFKLNDKQEGFTNFLAAGGKHSWNVIRSEADDMMFRHAGECGAHIFDQVKVESIEFVKEGLGTQELDLPVPNPGRPISATWSHRDGTSGKIKFDYLVDASGRQGLVSTKYLKNRKLNQGLKNLAYWGYWRGTGIYGKGTVREGVPFFEAVSDGSGWAWTIPLHDGTLSVGIVQNQDAASAKKKEMGSPSTAEFYHETLKLAPRVMEVLGDGKLFTDIKAASDWSYSASCYATPYVRIVGDAGCFIDPYFSSGVHLALNAALSAATTLCAAIKSDVDEVKAMKWHSLKVSEGYTRFLLVVLSAMQQIREKEKPILSDFDEDGFERAFAFFRPIIQGHADTNTGKLSQQEVSKTIDFCLHAFEQHNPEKRDEVVKKIQQTETDLKIDPAAIETGVQAKLEQKSSQPRGLTEDEVEVLKTLRARQMLRSEDIMDIESFEKDTIEGLAPRLERGRLTLVRAKERDMRLDEQKMAMGGEIMGETVQVETHLPTEVQVQ